MPDSGTSLHIGFIAHEYPNDQDPGGGLARYVQRIGQMLTRRGYRVTVVTMSTRQATWNDNGIWVYELLWPGYRLAPIYRSKFISFLTNAKSARSLYPIGMRILAARNVRKAVLSIHDKTPFHLIQATNCYGLGFSLRRNNKIPLISRISNYQPLWRSADGRQRSLAKTLCDWIEVKQVLDSDASFAPSDLLAQVYAKLEGHKLEVIRTPFDPPDLSLDYSFYERNLKDQRYLVYFGSLSKIKGVDLLGDVLPEVLTAYSDLQMVFVGNRDVLTGDHVLKYIMEKTASFKHRVMVYPALPRRLLFPVVQHALAVVMPSRVDNYPNACLEAQSLGKIVIGTLDSSLDEMIGDGKTGFLAQNGCANSLRLAIERVLTLSEDQRLQMESEVHLYAQQLGQQDRVCELESFYRTVIANFSNKRSVN